MLITVINIKTGESHVCCKSKAGKIIGVRYETILRWSKKLIKKPNHIEKYNDYLVSFNTTIHKQNKRINRMLKIV